ncbi:MAG: hypothetical protein KAH20_15185 [Methylococcales bacterium]|nr:hypothetical protein [Methylococcales bacterium]
MENSFFKILVLALFCLNVQAEEREYNIELIIFAQDQPTSEAFEEMESKIAWPRRVAIKSNYKKVKRKNLALLKSYSKLNRGRDYQTIMYEAWTQKVSPNSYSRAVKISNEEGTINGFFRLQRGHLVHMVVDIEYSPSDKNENSLSGEYENSPIYRLNEKRRFKLNETHYLDHPKFGILARVSPVETNNK